MKQGLNYILTLSLICMVTATLLTAVYLFTRPKILKQKARAQQEALKEVLPEAGYFEPVIKEGKGLYFRAYASADKQKLIGYAFIARGQGYSSQIETMAGIDRQGRISGIRILSQNETPGLGAKINEVLAEKSLWQRVKEIFGLRKQQAQQVFKPWFCEQFKGKKVQALTVVADKTERNIQAVTGATISSEALTNSVRQKAKQILSYGK